MYISSDTNVWVDFHTIGRLHHPFLLDHEYCISDLTLSDEILTPQKMQEDLTQSGLKVITPSVEEIYLLQTLQKKYRRISHYDALALSIAIKRGWILLSGDKALRDAANTEGVICRGTIWVYDELLAHQKISPNEYMEALEALLQGIPQGKIRLPRTELEKRILAQQQTK